MKETNAGCRNTEEAEFTADRTVFGSSLFH